MESKGRIFAIEEFSAFDGPGVRTTVFLKGCPLRCSWCHNPEGQCIAPDFFRSLSGCRNCGECLKAGHGALTEESIAACKYGLVKKFGEDYTAEALAEKLLKNRELLNAGGGGITFSGGEPLVQPEFVFPVSDLLKGKVHRALQTSGAVSHAVFREALSHFDYVLYDLKIMDPVKHRAFTGADNDCILENHRVLARSGIPFMTRIPLIPGVTDTAENIRQIAAFLRDNKATYAELLLYNKLAGSKYRGLLREYTPGFDENIAPSPRLEIFEEFGIQAKVI